jgi:excisionase family DNA binding protein
MPDQPVSTPEEDPWLTVQQVSDELKLNPATVRLWVRTGRIAGSRVGRAWRVRRSAVERALMAGASTGHEQPNAPAPSEGDPRNGVVRTEAPRDIAANILTVGPRPAEPS